MLLPPPMIRVAEPAECPIKKTIDGKTYCFQNDPALTKTTKRSSQGR
jgi:hypothetical protein